jgi:hypothetical protein
VNGLNRKTLQGETVATLVGSTELHVAACAYSRGQAKELREAETTAVGGTNTFRLAQLRGVHELEAAVHSDALTSIGCTVAVLEALGYETRNLHAARVNAEIRALLRTSQAPTDKRP